MGNQTRLKLILLLFLISPLNCHNWRTSTRDNKMVIYDAIITHDNDLKELNFTNIYDVEFESPEIETFSIELQLPMETVRKIYINYGNIPKVQVAPHIELFYIDRSNTRTVEITADSNYKTKDFAVTNGKLKSLPKSLSAMRNLQELNFYHNLIETVEMTELNGLDSLQKITLSSNKIIKISFSQAVLPNLKNIDLSFNRLKGITTNNFTDPLLEAFNLMGNQMEAVDLAQFSDFPLREINLDYNKLENLSPDSVHLPKLEIFSIASNHLSNVDFQNWKTPSVKVINVGGNQLKNIPGLTTAAIFPALEQVKLFPNPFDCDWLNVIVKELEARDVQVPNHYGSVCGLKNRQTSIKSDAP